MAANSITQQAYLKWQQWCQTIQQAATVDTSETKAQQAVRVKRLRGNYSEFSSYYFPHYATAPTASFQIQAAAKIIKDPDLKAAFKWARGHAKSVHLGIIIPMWLKCQLQRTINVMVLVGKSEDAANTLLGDLQAELEYNKRYVHDFGNQTGTGSWTDGAFVTADGCAFFARGRGQSPRGLRYRNHRPDYVLIDDIDDDKLCQNPKRVGDLYHWLSSALFGVLDGGYGRFIMVGNLISKNSVLAHWAATEGIHVSQVDVYNSKGEVSWASKWSVEQIKRMEKTMGYRAFQREMMNNPITEGAVFKNDWIHWAPALPLDQYDEIVAYCDPSFKGSTKNDYKAIKVWARKGTMLHCIDAFVRQCSISEMVRWLYDLHERIPSHVICRYLMEANFMQDIILDEFTLEGKLRGYQLPIQADRRKKPDKFQRIEAISPLWERGFVHYSSHKQTDRDMLTSIEQLLSFEKGSRAHDDAPDADEGAIYVLQKSERGSSFEPLVGRRPKASNIW